MYTDFSLDINKRIVGEKIYLRPICEDDSELIVKWRNQDNVRKYFFYRNDFTVESQKHWYKTKVKTGEIFQFIVCEKDSDLAIGCTYLQGYEKDTNCAESGIFLGADDIRGKGYGKEALELTVNFAFKELGVSKLIARAVADNKASVNTHIAVGYKIVDNIRQKVIPSGELLDTVMMEIVNE